MLALQAQHQHNFTKAYWKEFAKAVSCHLTYLISFQRWSRGKVQRDSKGVLQIVGRRISNLRYADDIVWIATSTQELQTLVNRLNIVSNRYDLLINAEKN